MPSDRVARTAFIAAQLRADERHQAEPLFADPFAPRFVDDQTRELTDQLVARMPSMALMLRLRTRHVDEVLVSTVSAGIKQVVLLGSGLDSRPLRFTSDGVRYFELDQAATLEYKATVLEGIGISPEWEMIPGDYLQLDLAAALRDRGFDPGSPTFVLWEGNTMYLPPAKTLEMFQTIRDLSARTVLTFDYVGQSVITRSSGDGQLTDAVNHVQQFGAPLLTGFDDIFRLADDLGYRVEDVHTMEELRQRYAPLEAGSPAMAHLSVATFSDR